LNAKIKPARIIFTGYRACGKSTVGQGLAARLGWDFIDSDALITGEYGEISALVAARGWPRFREIEEQVLFELAGRREAMIATGGGAVIHEKAWARLRRGSLVVWLAADPATVRRRLCADPASAGQRPGLTGKSADDEIEEVMAQREPIYRQGSDLKIDAARPIDEIVDEIIKHLA